MRLPPGCSAPNGPIANAITVFDDLNSYCWDEFHSCVQTNTSDPLLSSHPTCIATCLDGESRLSQDCDTNGGTFCTTLVEGHWPGTGRSLEYRSALCLARTCERSMEADVARDYSESICGSSTSCHTTLGCRWRLSESAALGIVFGVVAGILLVFVTALVISILVSRWKNGAWEEDEIEGTFDPLEFSGLTQDVDGGITASDDAPLATVWDNPDDEEDRRGKRRRLGGV